MRTVIFLLVVLGLLGGMHYYVWRRLIHDPGWPEPWSSIALGALLALSLMLPMIRIFGRGLTGGMVSALTYVAFVWMGILILLVLTLTFMDVGKLLARLYTVTTGRALLPTDPERRQVMARALAAVAGATGVGAGAFALVAARRVALVDHHVKLARLPVALDGMTIVQITDVHVSSIIGRDFVEHLVERINALRPDVVAITGDLVDGSVEALREAVAPLAQIEARWGTYFVTGNHEFYSGVAEWRVHLETLGVQVLSNRRVEIGHGEHLIDLAGVEDPTSGQTAGAVKQALHGRDPARECVLLAHQPRSIHEAARQGVGLQISGHTHGGQIWPWRYFVYLQQPYVDGHHWHGDSQIYVSRGTGSWGPPMRLGAPPEMTRFTLRRG